ncbi:MAG: DUF3152 domain-containing protein [Nitriliruptorales bacterium]
MRRQMAGIREGARGVRRAGSVSALLALLLTACQSPDASTVVPSPPAAPAPSASPRPSPTPDAAGPRTAPVPAERPTAEEEADVVAVRYRIERRVDDAATADFAEVVEATLEDPRGWEQAGFDLVRDPDATYLVVLAEGREVDRLCAPYETHGRYSCQNGPVVALNADRWREATPQWTGDLASYRRMLVNHEVGHLLGLHHPTPQCPGDGLRAAVMSQQSTELGGCLPNAWPVPWEIALAARHEEPLAPPHGQGFERPRDPRASDG